MPILFPSIGIRSFLDCILLLRANPTLLLSFPGRSTAVTSLISSFFASRRKVTELLLGYHRFCVVLLVAVCVWSLAGGGMDSPLIDACAGAGAGFVLAQKNGFHSSDIEQLDSAALKFVEKDPTGRYVRVTMHTIT